MTSSLVSAAVEQLQPLGLTGVGAPARVRSATIQKYGPDGQTPANQVEIDYSQAKVDPDGAITGGTVQTVSRYAGQTLSTGAIRFSPEGRVASATTTIADRIGGTGTHRVVESDLTGLKLLHGRVSEGTLKVRSHRADGTKASEGTIAFAKERAVSAEIASYASDGSGKVERHSSIDYSQAKLDGGEIAGGTVTLQTRTPEGRILAHSTTEYDQRGLPTKVVVHTHHESGEGVRTVVEHDYSSVKFNALKEIESGALSILTKRPTGEITSRSRVSYAGSVPSGYDSESYDAAGSVARRLRIDYRGVRFNQSRRPIHSTVRADTTDAAGAPITSVESDYGADGVVLRRRTLHHMKTPGSPHVHSHTDCSQLVYDSQHAIAGGQATTVTVRGRSRVETVRTYTGSKRYTTKEKHVYDVATSQPRRYVKSFCRPDGTSHKLVKVTLSPQGQPQRGTVTHFGLDGRTVVSKRRIDYSQAQVQAGKVVGGTLQVASRDGRNRLRSRSQVTFA